jgi:RHH-type proline utilization regulon transcriptional repressor/proline dehydrogenase/delta 1-pyrroline-5-carboxylate dehydrogenase
VLAIASAVVETDDQFLARVAIEKPARIRLLGGDASTVAEAVGGAPDVAIWSGAVTASGRIELLPFLREQAIAVTAHRFGNPDRGMIALPV